MRNMIVSSLGILIWLMGGLMLLGGLVYGVQMMQYSAVMGLLVMVGAVLYAIIFCGIFFMFLDIRDATRKTAEAVSKMAGS